MACAAKSTEKGVDREIANLNERIRVIEQNMSAMKELINEALVQDNWPGGNSGLLVLANALGASGVESDNSNTESKPKEMEGTGKEEGGFKILKESEFNHRMKMGLCVRCDKKYRKHHNRVCKNKNLPLQVVKDEDVICDQEKTEEIKKEEVEQEENVRAHQFKFLGKIGSREVTVFVGLAATHNFISKELVNALEIPLQSAHRRYRVNSGFGEFEGAEVCEGVVLKTQGIEIVETFFLTDLAIADVVLGNQWLRSLGKPTLQGMPPMSLTFERHGRTVKLEADPSLSSENEVGLMILEWI